MSISADRGRPVGKATGYRSSKNNESSYGQLRDADDSVDEETDPLALRDDQ